MIKTFGGNGRDSAQGLAVDSAGNMFIGGTFNARANFDPNGSFTIGAPSTGAGFIVALDHTGAFRWAGSFGDPNGVEDLAVDDSGNVLASGFYSGNVDFDSSHAVSIANVASTLQAYVLKWTSSGAFVFADGFGGSGFTRGSAITSDRDGNIYGTGNFTGTSDFDPGAGTSNLTAPSTGQNYVTKLNSSGALVWAKSIGGASDAQFAEGDIAVDKAENVYVTGVFAGTKDFDPTAGTHNLTSAGQDDIFIDKLDSAGNFVFATSQGGTDEEGAASLVLDRTGNILTTGTFQGTANFGTSADIINFTSEGDQDVYVSKLDSSGLLA